MKLVSIDHSPYASRVRMQIHKKGLPVEIIGPPLPLKTPEFKQKFSLGKVPLLELPDGSFLPESVPIMEYLEDCFPEIPLRPESPLGIARMRVMITYADTHLGPAVFAMLRFLMGSDTATDKKQIISALRIELDKLNRWLLEVDEPRQRSLNLGDIALSTHIWYTTVQAPLFNEDNILEGYDQIQSWWSWVKDDAAVSRVLAEMEIVFRGFANSLKK